MAVAHVSYQWTDDEWVCVEVEADDSRPDMLDELARRAAWLLGESIAAVNTKRERPPKHVRTQSEANLRRMGGNPGSSRVVSEMPAMPSGPADRPHTNTDAKAET